jgi:hypothetical protein
MVKRNQTVLFKWQQFYNKNIMLWEPSTKRQESGEGVVTWLPSRVMQQWRTGYLATEQSDATMEDWLPGY